MCACIIFFFISILHVNIASTVEHHIEASNDEGSIPIACNIFFCNFNPVILQPTDKDPISQERNTKNPIDAWFKKREVDTGTLVRLYNLSPALTFAFLQSANGHYQDKLKQGT